LCVPTAIDAINAMLPGGWDAVRARNRALALQARDILCDALSIEPPAPDEMIGAIAAIPLPPAEHADPPPPGSFYAHTLQTRLVKEFGVQAPINPWPARPARLLRISAQLYNDVPQYERLATALRQLL
jgi:isopenicillin-N epimerase